MKKVLIITYYWPPSGGAGVQRWVKFSKYLKDFDIEPIVCTSLDSSDDKIEDYCRQHNFNFFRGSLENKLTRWLDCARYFDVPYFIRRS